jgi:outer membrane protein OmpA-like peptidoglycan-associated protein
MTDELAAIEVVKDTAIVAIVEDVIAKVVVEKVVEEIKEKEIVKIKEDKKPLIHAPEDLFRDILFKFNKMEIADESKEQVRKISEYMKANPNYVVNLSGHSDYLGSNDVNEEVSKQRALVIFNELVKDGADPYRVHYDYFGETKPKADGKNADGSDNPGNRSKNRRVDFGLEQLNMFRFITYNSGSSSVDEKARKVLDEVIAYSQANPRIKVDLRGFSDPTGPSSANMILSEKRTQAAVDYLVANGVSKSLVISKAYGETIQTPPNMPAEYGRRVEIRIQ